ncbi:unnamed protein product, partial [Heterosigma akashiwo]
RGRPKRNSFELQSNHALFEDYELVIRSKFHIPMFAGHIPGGQACPPDNCSDIRKGKFLHNIDQKAKAAIALDGLVKVAKAWDRKDASMNNRERWRTIATLLQNGHSSKRNEKIARSYRLKNADLWKDVKDSPKRCVPGFSSTNSRYQQDQVSTDNINLLDLISDLNTNMKPATTSAEHNLRQQFTKTFGEADEKHQETSYNTNKPDIVNYCMNRSDSPNSKNFKQIATAINKLKKPSFANTETPDPTVGKEGTAGPEDPLEYGPSKPCVDDPTRTFVANCTPTPEQQALIDFALQPPTPDTSLCLVLAPGGSGKTWAMNYLKTELEKRGKQMLNLCPTGVGACEQIEGRTWHGVFRPDLGDDLPQHLRISIEQILHDQIVLINLDEISMVGTQSFTFLDKRLRQVKDPNKMFGGMRLMCTGDFLQLPAIDGDLCKAMYNFRNETDAKARYLLRHFNIFEFPVEHHMRAKDIKQQKILNHMRVLPPFYPGGVSDYTKEEKKKFVPMKEIVDTLCKELTAEDIRKDPNWKTQAPIATTTNEERTILNAVAIHQFAKFNGKIVVRWKNPLIQNDLPDAVLNLLYSKPTERPKLYSHFCPGAPAIVLDNGAGNVQYLVANGTPCEMHSLGWDNNPEAERQLQTLLQEASKGDIVTIDHVPEYINVKLCKRTAKGWPADLNLSENRDEIVIPIPTMKRTRFAAKFGSTTLHYTTHALTPSFAMTCDKLQGQTKQYIIILLEKLPNTRKPLTFEKVYVIISRVPGADRLRCLPLSAFFHFSR